MAEVRIADFHNHDRVDLGGTTDRNGFRVAGFRACAWLFGIAIWAMWPMASASANPALLGCYSFEGPAGQLHFRVFQQGAGYAISDADGSNADMLEVGNDGDLRFVEDDLAFWEISANARALAALANGWEIVALVTPELQRPDHPEWGSTAYYYTSEDMDADPVFKVPCPN